MLLRLNNGLCCLQRTFREIMFLQELNNHENIIRSAVERTLGIIRCCAHATLCEQSVGCLLRCRILNVIKAENDRDIYLIFEYMETDLHAVIRANILEEIHKSYIMYQLLKALKYMHTAELLHRDIKVPSCGAAARVCCTLECS